ncbi:hypothetical protein CF327_g5146 [Tilletia walkeri]|uniref:Uncharacterized protein n=1 Tax=Tilletia walkeri TaxID=117179 RepID=A0A8X7N8K9_9BASI|nr:hypothetical protein CF327_g5146 [Tilletia walkeri]KAE8267615.1 hypothetical protein A4X09_0g4734 [Tilletia walkeri]
MPVIDLDKYSPLLFSGLPSIEDAATQFEAFGGLARIEAALGTVARKHPAAAFGCGLQLLHRHSDLDPDEIMVGFGSTTMPVKRSELAQSSLCKLRPTIWGLRPGSQIDFVPLEFAMFDDASTTKVELDPEFARDVAKVLVDFELEQTLGLAILPEAGEAFVVNLEATYGRANVVVPANLFAEQQDSIEALWDLVALGHADRLRATCRVKCMRDPQDRKHYCLGHRQSELQNVLVQLCV